MELTKREIHLIDESLCLRADDIKKNQPQRADLAEELLKLALKVENEA